MELPVALGEWTVREGPLHARLADALRAAILRGDVPTGSRLPPERACAGLLHVSRNTVAAAYEALADEGWLRRRQGSGTYVQAGGVLGRPRDRRALVQSAYLARDGATSPEIVELTTASPTAYDVIPEEAFELAAHDLHEATKDEGYLPYGLPALREAITARLTAHHLPTRPEEILVTSGAQQAIALAVELLVRPGDRVIVEDPTYPGALDVLRHADAALVPLPVDDEGADVDALPGLLGRAPVRAFYVCSTFQSPTGRLLSERRRRDLARIADQQRLAVIDDTALAETSLEVTVPPLVAAFAPDAPIVTAGSLSKVLWGGLRVGWIRASPPLVERVARLRVIADHGGAIPSQVLALRLLEHVEDTVKLRRAEARLRLRRLTGLLDHHLPDWSYRTPAGGLLLWVELPRGDSAEFAQLALRHGVAVVPGSVASPFAAPSRHLRLPFGLEEQVAEEGVRRLAAAWAAYEPSPSSPAPLRVID